MRRQFAGWPTTNTDMSRPRFLIAALALLGPAAAVVIGARGLRNGAEQNQLLPIRHCVETADGPYRILVWRRSDAGRKPKPLILYSPGWGGAKWMFENACRLTSLNKDISWSRSMMWHETSQRQEWPPTHGLPEQRHLPWETRPDSRVRPPLLRPGWNWPFARLAGS